MCCPPPNKAIKKRLVCMKYDGRLGGSVGNLETFRRGDVGLNLGAVTRTWIFFYITSNKGRTIIYVVGTQNSTLRLMREMEG